MDSHIIEKCVAMVAVVIVAIAGLWISKSTELASMAIGAIAGLAGSGITTELRRTAASILPAAAERPQGD